jgi:hypothetical protein
MGAGGTMGAAGKGGTTGTGGTGGACSFTPSPDGCNTCTCTPNGIVCTDRACPPDGGSPACELDAVYKFGMTGGHVVYEDQSALTPPASYQHTRRPSGGTTTSLSCAPALPACNTANAIDVSDVMRDLNDPDVQAALKTAQPLVVGHDERPVDGSIFSVMRADGHGFMVGGDCPLTSRSCNPIPKGLAQLVATLRALDEQQLKDASCTSFK